MKKIIVLVFVAALSVITSQAAVLSTSQTVVAGTMTNILSAPAKVVAFTITSAANDSGYVWFIDSETKNYRYTNSAYNTYSRYVSNVITTNVDFFGHTNYYTNLSLYTITNTVAAATNNLYAIPLTWRVGTNVTEMLDRTVYFNRGMTVTNAGSGNVTINVQYVPQ